MQPTPNEVQSAFSALAALTDDEFDHAMHELARLRFVARGSLHQQALFAFLDEVG